MVPQELALALLPAPEWSLALAPEQVPPLR